MGDVKRSGKTFEERKAASIAKQVLEAERKAGLVAKIEASKTSEQKLKERQAKMEWMMLLGTMGMTGWCISPLNNRGTNEGR